MNKKQYNEIVELYADSLYRFMLKSCNQEELSKDIVQDAFEKLWLKHESIEFISAKSYLFTSAYHRMIDYYRKNKRMENEEKIPLQEHLSTNEYNDLNEILNKAINLLPEQQRSVLLLRDYEGYAYEEIAEITGLNLSQVKVYIYRARVFLKNKIGSIEALI